jgi:hypothetical protein
VYFWPKEFSTEAHQGPYERICERIGVDVGISPLEDPGPHYDQLARLTGKANGKASLYWTWPFRFYSPTTSSTPVVVLLGELQGDSKITPEWRAQSFSGPIASSKVSTCSTTASFRCTVLRRYTSECRLQTCLASTFDLRFS